MSTNSEIKTLPSTDDMDRETLLKDLRAKTQENEVLRAKVGRLDLELCEARMKVAQHHTEAEEVHKMREVSEELLTKAKSIIFEKVKQCKNQELQIDALNAQVTSLKDVVAITKNLLEIRNLEVTHLQDQISAMNGKVAAEKERQDLVHSKLEKMIRMNGELKREYETQLVLFNSLRERYAERELARGLVKVMNKEESQGEVIVEPAAVITEQQQQEPISTGPPSSLTTITTPTVMSEEPTVVTPAKDTAKPEESAVPSTTV